MDYYDSMRLSPLIICFLIFSCSVEKELSTIENLHILIESLSSDDMQGRNPGTEGGQLAKNYISEQFSSLNLKTSSFKISSSPNIIALDSLAPNAKFLDLNNSASLIEPKVLARQTSLTKDVVEKSIIDSDGSLL